jgi:hypothetical protein
MTDSPDQAGVGFAMISRPDYTHWILDPWPQLVDAISGEQGRCDVAAKFRSGSQADTRRWQVGKIEFRPSRIGKILDKIRSSMAPSCRGPKCEWLHVLALLHSQVAARSPSAPFPSVFSFVASFHPTGTIYVVGPCFISRSVCL